MKERHIIAAVTDDYGIGHNGELLYHIKADMQHFKDLTLGNVVIMGRKTFESIGKPLLSRDNIVVTSKDLNIEGVHCVRSLQDAYRLAETLDGIKVFVIGGGQLYAEALQYTDTLDLTHIYATAPNADTYFPNDLSDFIPVKDSERYWYDGITFKFTTYKRKIEPSVS